MSCDIDMTPPLLFCPYIHLILNLIIVGEFLIVPHSDLRGYAKQARFRGVTVLRFPSYGIVGKQLTSTLFPLGLFEK